MSEQQRNYAKELQEETFGLSTDEVTPASIRALLAIRGLRLLTRTSRLAGRRFLTRLTDEEHEARAARAQAFLDRPVTEFPADDAPLVELNPSSGTTPSTDTSQSTNDDSPRKGRAKNELEPLWTQHVHFWLPSAEAPLVLPVEEGSDADVVDKIVSWSGQPPERLAGAASSTEELGRIAIDATLNDLVHLDQQATEIATTIRETVSAAREAGATWQEIGQCLGVSKQAVHYRFGRP